MLTKNIFCNGPEIVSAERFSLAELETLVADNQLTDGWIYPALYFLKQFLKQS